MPFSWGGVTLAIEGARIMWLMYLGAWAVVLIACGVTSLLLKLVRGSHG
jgi:hypothetical protein